KEKHSSLFFAARYYFEAYIAAVKRAGLDYDRIVREQLHGKKRWRKVEAATSGAGGPAEMAVEPEEEHAEREEIGHAADSIG
ncbi:MAG TPA: hypothetical protein VGQ99_07710, partial [Tepidisphaeraceae bacterium]|nr:hypothetical protein [Tepidisphaeraceae bacterium]